MVEHGLARGPACEPQPFAGRRSETTFALCRSMSRSVVSHGRAAAAVHDVHGVWQGCTYSIARVQVPLYNNIALFSGRQQRATECGAGGGAQRALQWKRGAAVIPSGMEKVSLWRGCVSSPSVRQLYALSAAARGTRSAKPERVSERGVLPDKRLRRAVVQCRLRPS